MLKGLRRDGIQAGALGIADQVLLSATNLAIGLTLAREMSPVAFGVYVVTWALYLVSTSAQISLITDPLVVLGPQRGETARAGYFAAVWRLQCGLSLMLALLAGGAALVAWTVLQPDSVLPAALAGLALAIVPLHGQTFLRSVFFARLRLGQVLWNDVLLSVLRLAGLALLAWWGALSTFSVMATAALAALVSATVGLFQASDVIAAPGEALRTICREHWRFGRWLLATSGAYWASGQAPVLLGSAMMTPVAAAILKACQYLVAPLNVAFMGLDGVIAPRAARLRATAGPDATRRFLSIVAAGCAAGAGIYGVALLPATGPLMRWLYRGQYGDYAFLVGIFLADAFLSAISRAPSLSLKVAGRTKPIFYANLMGAAAGLTALVSLVPVHGVTGAALAAPIASGATLAALLALQRRSAARPISADRAAVRAAEP